MTKPEIESIGFAEKPDEIVCKCRTFRLDDRGAYLDGDNFVHTLISCPTRRLNNEIAELERAVIEAAEAAVASRNGERILPTVDAFVPLVEAVESLLKARENK